MDGANDRQRKDRLIQTRVPQNLESTLKDEARKRRLSVSHLIRNVLEDTFHLMDNVVHEVDRVVADSVGMAQTLRRDAQRLAATARGRTSHRAGSQSEPDEAMGDAPEEDAEDLDATDADSVGPEAAETPQGDPEEDGLAEAILGTEAALSDPPGPPVAAQHVRTPQAFAEVFALQEAVVYRSASCCSCGMALRRGARAYFGLAEAGAIQRADAWLCADCTEALNDEEALSGG
jgi:hypothetical protein